MKTAHPFAHLLAALALACCLPIHAAPVQTREREVAFQDNGITLAGTLLEPGTAGPHPAMLFMPGSGSETRDGLLDLARAFAGQGMVTLVYDKRGDGKSQGSWTRESLEDLASDAAAGIRLLRATPGVDPARVGAWGISQSGWVLPRLVHQLPDLPFVICVTGGGTTPREVEDYGYDNELTHAGFGQADKDAAHALVDRYMRYLADGRDRAGLVAAIQASRGARWSSLVDLGRVLPEEADRGKWAWVATYDPAADMAAMRMPVLVLLGGRDPFTPAADALAGWHRALSAAGNPFDLVLEFPAAMHGMRTNGHDMHVAPVYAEGYLEEQLAWLRRIGMLP